MNLKTDCHQLYPCLQQVITPPLGISRGKNGVTEQIPWNTSGVMLMLTVYSYTFCALRDKLY